MLNGRRITTVDVHAHCVFPEVEDVVAGTALDRVQFPSAQMLGPARLEEMNRRGIDYQALSMTINGHWWYAADRDLAARIVRAADEALAEWVNEHPDRFVGLSSVALQYPDLAAEQLEYAVTELGARGAAVGGQARGEIPSSERFDPFWAKAVELDVPVFMHPAGGAPHVIRENGLAGRGGLVNVVGNPLETNLFLIHMMFDGTLDRFPDLKIVGAHGGGYLPSYSGPCRSRLHATRRFRLPQHEASERVPSNADLCRFHGVLRRGAAAPGCGDGCESSGFWNGCTVSLAGHAGPDPQLAITERYRKRGHRRWEPNPSIAHRCAEKKLARSSLSISEIIGVRSAKGGKLRQRP